MTFSKTASSSTSPSYQVTIKKLCLQQITSFLRRCSLVLRECFPLSLLPHLQPPEETPSLPVRKRKSCAGSSYLVMLLLQKTGWPHPLLNPGTILVHSRLSISLMLLLGNEKDTWCTNNTFSTQKLGKNSWYFSKNFLHWLAHKCSCMVRWLFVTFFLCCCVAKGKGWCWEVFRRDSVRVS